MADRYYKNVPGADGPLASVTTVLDRGYPLGDLVDWQLYHTARTAVFDDSLRDMPKGQQVTHIKNAVKRVLEVTAEHGTRVHNGLETWMRGLDLPDMGGHSDALIEWANVYDPEPSLIEFYCANTYDGYAGSGDLIATVNYQGRRKTLLIDLKTSTGLNHKHRLQLAAYRHAQTLFECVENCDEKGCKHEKRDLGPMPSVDGCAILHIPRDKPQEWSFVEVLASAPEFELFRKALGIYRFKKNTDRKPVGTVIEPTAQEALAA